MIIFSGSVTSKRSVLVLYYTNFSNTPQYLAYTGSSYTMYRLLQSAHQVAQGVLDEMMAKEEEMRPQCEQERMLLSHNHHISTGCMYNRH